MDSVTSKSPTVCIAYATTYRASIVKLLRLRAMHCHQRTTRPSQTPAGNLSAQKISEMHRRAAAVLQGMCVVSSSAWKTWLYYTTGSRELAAVSWKARSRPLLAFSHPVYWIQTPVRDTQHTESIGVAHRPYKSSGQRSISPCCIGASQ